MRTYHTMEQEADRLHLSRTKLYALVKSGRIPARRIGGVRAPLLFVPEEVDAALDQAHGQSQTAGAAAPSDLPSEESKE